jgi:putative ABC transport system ATP-binding protein
MPILRAQGVTKSFPAPTGKLEVLRGLDLAIEAGEFVAIKGVSGSGKSTLLSILAGLDRATSGEIELDGERLDLLPERELARVRREKVGFVFQAFHLVPSLTALENVTLPLGFGSGRIDEARGRDLLDAVGLTPRALWFPDQLSGGEKQRVAIARALACDPAVIFADEPTGNLDTATGLAVLDLLERAARERKRTLVLVTHEAELAARADRRVSIRDGVIA